MISTRQLGRGLVARLLARVLIGALVFSLAPPPRAAEASIPSAPLTSLPVVEDLAPSSSSSMEILVCVVVVVADPLWLTKSAFGELLAHTGSDPQPYAFTGEPLDPNSGFQYHRARWMDPRVGRFSATDPYPGSIEEALTLHRYVYAGTDPVNKTDPSGLFFSLSVSLTAIGISTTINAISVPIAEAMISTTASLELLPIWVRDRRWDGKTQLLGPFPGWPAEDMQAQLGQARSIWGRAGVVIHTAAERGPILVDDSNIPRDQPASGQRIEEFIRAAGIQSVRANQVPVVFIRTIGGTTRKGRAFVGSLRESASIAMPLGASELSLAHEVGHVLGLDHHFIPWNLMFPLAVGGSGLTERQAADAREAVRIRSGGR
jgi:RHS repeat-associated protein